MIQPTFTDEGFSSAERAILENLFSGMKVEDSGERALTVWFAPEGTVLPDDLRPYFESSFGLARYVWEKANLFGVSPDTVDPDFEHEFREMESRVISVLPAGITLGRGKKEVYRLILPTGFYHRLLAQNPIPPDMHVPVETLRLLAEDTRPFFYSGPSCESAGD